MKECEEKTRDVIEEHMDIMEELNAKMLEVNEADDKQLKNLLDFKRSIGIHVEESWLSIKVRKLLRKKRKKKTAAFYDIAEVD